MTKRFARLARTILWERDTGALYEGSPFRRQSEACRHATILVGAFYCFLLFFATAVFLETLDLDGAVHVPPFWLTSWTALTGARVAGGLIAYGFIASAFLAALWSRLRTFRVMAAIFFLQYLATAAFQLGGRGNPTSLAGFWVSLVLIALPGGAIARSRIDRQIYLFVFWLAQALILLFYSLAGAAKVLETISHLGSGDVSYVSSDGLAVLVANWIHRAQVDSPLATLIIDHPSLGAPLAIFTVYVELFAFVIAFRPSLHRIWGGALISFHVGVAAILGVNFSENIFLVGLMLLCSPFAPSRSPTWYMILRNLPLVGLFVKKGAAFK